MRGQTMSVKKTNLEVCTHACTLRAHCTLHGNIIFDILEQSSFQKYTTCWVFLALCLMLYLCICVFLYLYFCICAFDTWEYHFWYTWTILFSKLYYMLGLSGTLSYAVFVYCVFVYLCICIFVFALLTLGNIIFDILEQSSFQKYTTWWVFLALCNMLYLCICVFVYLCICIWVGKVTARPIWPKKCQSAFFNFLIWAT